MVCYLKFNESSSGCYLMFNVSFLCVWGFYFFSFVGRGDGGGGGGGGDGACSIRSAMPLFASRAFDSALGTCFIKHSSHVVSGPAQPYA